MKSHLIVGGSSGIGKAFAVQLCKAGHKVYATYRNTPPDIQYDQISYSHLDVIDELHDLSFVPENIDSLVYCPGSISLRRFSRIKPDAYLDDFNLQVVGAIKVLQNILQKLKAAERPSMVFFSTVAVQTGFNFHSQVAASKGALEGLTRSLAAEFAPKIRVNCTAPLLTDTPLAGRLLNSDEKKEANAQRHPLKKIGQPQAIASMAAFLLSDEARWVTGQVLHVDGGMSNVKN